MRKEDINTNKTGQMNGLKINPKYYPLIWVVMIFSVLVRDFYQIYTSYTALDNVALAVYYGLIDIVIGGGSSAVFTLLISYLLHNMGAKRGLRAIPKKDFTYIIMIFVSIAWFISGVANMFGFLDPVVSYCNVFTTDIVVMTVSLALMFFLVFVPNYLNPRQAHRHFEFYGKIYVIFNSVVYVLGAIGILSCIAVAEDPTLLAQMDGIYYSIDGVEVPISVVFEEFAYAKTALEITAYVSIALSVAMIVAYLVLSNILKNKAKDFKEDVKPENMEGIYFTDGKNFYTVDDIKNGSFGTNGNPFDEAASKSDNPFDDGDDDDDKVFEEFDL